MMDISLIPKEPKMKTVGCVGTGVIGRGWMRVFSRGGCRTNLFDKDPGQVKKALVWLEEQLKLDIADGFITKEEAKQNRGRVFAHDDLREALAGAEYIQESGPENLQAKQKIFAKVDAAANPKAIIASSTSGMDMNEIAKDLPGISRCIMAHPFNPPHIIPLVEVMPTKRTDPEVVKQTVLFLSSLGQKPVLVKFFVTGYLINRIQAAVVREANHLVESGVADVDTVDSVIRDGLGLRWALFGQFGTDNTNADGGIRECYTRYGHLYTDIMNDLDPKPPSFTPEMIERIGKGTDAMEGTASLSAICRWRDRMVLKIRALKEKDPHP
jgi:L-gulonate 3-dehydrogenase